MAAGDEANEIPMIQCTNQGNEGSGARAGSP